MTAFLALVRADLVLYFSNRRAVLMGFAAPILIAAFFGFLFSQGGGKPSRIPVGLSDLDRSVLSQKVAAALRADEAFLLTEAPVDEAAKLLVAGKLRVTVVLPAGFGAQAPGAMFGASAKPEVLLRYDPSQDTVLPIVRGLLAQHVSQQVSQSVFNTGGSGLAAMRVQALAGAASAPEFGRDLDQMFASIDRVQQRSASVAAASVAASAPAAAGAASVPAVPAGGMGLPFVTREEAAVAGADSRYNSYAHAFAGMGVQFVLLMGIDLGVGLLAMRRLGLWKRLRAAPLSKAVLLGSRVASCTVIAVVVQVVIFGVAIAAFGVRIHGSVLGFAALMLAFGLMTGSFGLLIAAIGRSPEVTRGLAVVVTLLMVMLGGAWVPSFIFPPWLQQASLVVPTRWAVDGFDAMTWRGLGLADAGLPVLVMLGFALAFAALALARFDWEE